MFFSLSKIKNGFVTLSSVILKKEKLPPLAKNNMMKFPEKPPCLNLT
jgi:hypothetical protein